jgi:hypothetical protein
MRETKNQEEGTLGIVITSIKLHHNTYIIAACIIHILMNRSSGYVIYHSLGSQMLSHFARQGMTPLDLPLRPSSKKLRIKMAGVDYASPPLVDY